MAGRGLSAALISAMTAEIVRPIYFVELDFSGGFVRACDAPTSYSFDADGDTVEEEFKGLGDLGAITDFTEDTEGQVTSITVTLAGIKSSLVALARGEKYQGRTGKVWKSFLDADFALVDDPVLAFSGVMDTMSIEIDGRQASISVRMKSRDHRWERAADQARYSHEDHKNRYPDDDYFEFAAEVEKGKEVFWGVTI